MRSFIAQMSGSGSVASVPSDKKTKALALALMGQMMMLASLELMSFAAHHRKREIHGNKHVNMDQELFETNMRYNSILLRNAT